MSQSTQVSESARLRLARYHCFLEELRAEGHASTITSRVMAKQLGVTEESVRSDVGKVDFKGRPGEGYDINALHAALAAFLGLSAQSPFIVVGSLPLLEALPIIFPASEFGMRPIAYFSERDQDTGSVVGGIEVRPLSEIEALDTGAENVSAVVACEPGSVDEALQALSVAGVSGVLMLTPRLRPVHPVGMLVTYFRIPCALKSLASSAHAAEAPVGARGSCCV